VSSADTALIVRVLETDDRHAFAELVRRHQSAVRALLRRLSGDAALADDLAQETFLSAYRALAQFRGGARFSSWLYRIAYNAFVAHARKATAVHEAPAASTTAMEQVLHRHDLSRALDALRPEERAAISLTYGQDVTHEEAAEILKVPLGTLKTHVLRAKDKLRARLNPTEVT
jgi:RNA polymerase sigma factor (sigma-70 family)